MTSRNDAAIREGCLWADRIVCAWGTHGAHLDRGPDVARLLAAEGLAVAAVGSLAGTALGIGYAGLMIWGLQTLWVGAIVTPFLSLHVGWLSMAASMIRSVRFSATHVLLVTVGVLAAIGAVSLSRRRR